MNELSADSLTVNFDALRALCQDDLAYQSLLSTAASSLQDELLRFDAQRQAPKAPAEFFHRLFSVLSYLLRKYDLEACKRYFRGVVAQNWAQTREDGKEVIECLLKQVNYKLKILDTL